MAWPGARRTYRAGVDGGVPPSPQTPTPPLQTGRSGYEQLVNRWDVPAPMLAVHDPRGIPFQIGTPVPVAAIGVGNRVGYVPAWYGDSRIGRNPGGAAIGRLALWHLRPVHGRLDYKPSDPIGSFTIGLSRIEGGGVLVGSP